MGVPKAAFDAFISYSRRDKDFVRQLVNHLQDCDHTAWVDWQDILPLSQWRNEIQEGILSANNFLFILSPDSLASQECSKELEWAVVNHKRLVPVVCRSITGYPVPKSLADVNWIIFDERDFDECFQALLTALDTDINHVKTHTRLLTRAREWDNQKRDSSFLLRGTDLEFHEDWLAQASEYQPRPTQLQLDYVANSRVVETQRYKKEMRHQRIALGSVISALIVVTILGLFAEGQRREAIENEIRALNSASTSSLILDQPLEAMLRALRANIQLRKARWIEAPLPAETLSTLSQAAYRIQERNRLVGHDDWIYGVEFVPVEYAAGEEDNPQLVSGSLDGSLKIWSLDGQTLNTLRASDGGKITNIALSPDGKQIASVGEDTFVRLWSLDGKLLNTFKGHENWVYGVAFSPDGQMVASGSVDSTVRLWSQDGSLVSLMTGHSGIVTNVAFHPMGSTLVSGSLDGTLKIWQTDGTLVNTIDTKTQIYDVSFSPDGEFIASGDENGTIEFWQADGTLIRTLKDGDNALKSLDFNPDGQLIAAAGVDGIVHVWQVDGSLITTLAGHQNDIQSVAFSPDGSLIASASRDLEIRIWHWDNPWIETLKGHTDSVKSIAINPQDQGIVSASLNGELYFWSETGQLLKTVPTTLNRINALEISPDGEWLAIAGEGEDPPAGLIQLWTAAGDSQRLSVSQGNYVNAVTFSPDGERIASGSDDGTIQIRNLDGKLQQTLEYGNNVLSIAFSADGRYLAAGGEGGLKIWDLSTRSLTHNYEQTADIYSVSFSPVDQGSSPEKDQTLVFANSDRTIGLWSLDESEPKLLEGHEGEVQAVQFSPTGEQFASAGTDRTVRLWNKDGTPIATVGTHGASVETLEFSPDGSKLITGSDDQTLIIWDVSIVNSETLVKLGCSWLNDYLQHNDLVADVDRKLCADISFADFPIP